MAEEQKKIDFKDEKVRKKLYTEIGQGFFDRSDEIQKWNRHRLALKEFLKENKTLPEDNPSLYKECQDLLVRFQWYSFFNLISDEVASLLEKGLGIALSDKTYPLETYLHIFLLNIPSLSLREEYKEKLRQAIVDNKDRVSSGKVKSIIDWLKLYNQELGTERVEKIKIAEFLNRNENIVKLSSFEKTKIKRLFELYEELKIPANTIEGFEEEIYVVNEKGEIELHHRGEIENITRAVEREEAVEQAKKQSLPPPPSPPIDLNTAIKDAVEGAGLTLSDKALQTRFENIAKSYFGDIRSEIETRIVLKRDTKVGGMGFDDGSADKVINIFKKEKPQVTVEEFELADEKKAKVPADAGLMVRLKQPEELITVETRMHAAPLKPEEKPKKALEEKLKEPGSKPKPKLEKKQAQEPELQPVLEKKTEPKIAPTKAAPKVEPPPSAPEPPKAEPEKPPSQVSIKSVTPPIPEIQKPIARLPEEKPRVEEIRVKPRAQGPVDELRFLSLVDWRRWGSTQNAIQKIQDKINLLAEESLIKKAEAIKAWKESEINRLYLEIGEESINEGKSVEQVIKTRQQQKKSTLTQEEFDAVVGLNQKLRF